MNPASRAVRVSRASAPTSTPKAAKASPARHRVSSHRPHRPTASEVKRATAASSTRPTTTQAAAAKAIFSPISAPGDTSPRDRRTSALSSRSDDSAAAASSTPTRARLTSSAPAKPKAESGSRPGAAALIRSLIGLLSASAALPASSRLLPVSTTKLISGSIRRTVARVAPRGGLAAQLVAGSRVVRWRPSE